MASLKFLSSLLLECYFNLKLIAQVFLILLHLLHCHAKVFLRFDFLTGCLFFVSLAPFVKRVGETLEVVDNMRYFLVSYIFLIFKFFDFSTYLFASIVKLVL